MAIEPKTRIEIFDDMQAYLQSLASNLTDYNDGSILKSILDAPAAEMEQLWNALNVAFTAAYVSTATGDDLDNKVGDFGLDRNNATYASGYVTFGRSTAFNQDFTIPSGTVVQTASTSTVPGIQFETTELVTLPANQLNVSSVPIRAVASGATGNTSAGQITVISSPPAGIETVTNPAATAGGTDEESDADLRARVPLYLSSLARGTKDALEAAALAVDGVSSVSISENDPTPGWVQVYVADSAGTATDEMIEDVQAQMEDYRPVAVMVQVRAPIIQYINVDSWIDVSGGYSDSNVLANVRTAVTTFLSRQKLGEPVYRSKLIEAIVDVDGVDSVNTLAEQKIVDEGDGVLTALKSCFVTAVLDDIQTTESNVSVTIDNAAFPYAPAAGDLAVYLYYDTGKVTNFASSATNNDLTLIATPIVNEVHTTQGVDRLVLDYATTPGAFTTDGTVTSNGVWLAANSFSIGTATFSGSGLNDLTSGGTYSSTSLNRYKIEIDTVGATDTFKWSDDGGQTYQLTGVIITGAAQTLNNGVTVTFGAVTGHTLNDYWEFSLEHSGTNYATGGYVASDGVTLYLGTSVPAPSSIVYTQYTETNGANTQTKVSCDYYKQQCNTVNDIADVEGVWYLSDTLHTGTNFYLDGEFDSTGKVITLGTTTASETDNVLVNYWIETGSEGLKPFDDVDIESNRVARGGTINAYVAS